MSESAVWRRGRRLLRLGAAAVGALVPLGICVVTACSDTKSSGALVVAVDSNVPLPGYIDSFLLEATQSGITMFGEQFFVVGGKPVSSDQTQLPGTLALINPGTSSDPVTVRLLGLSSDGTVRLLREVTTTVPSAGASLLRLSLDALCFGEADTFPSVDESFESVPQSGAVGSCGPAQTCVAGGCVAQKIPSLPPYDPAAFGDAGATCFPVATCFDDAPENERGFETITFDGASCTVPVPLVTGSSGALVAAAPEQLNVGVPLPSGDCGNAATCLAPLDSVSLTDVPISGFYSDGTLIHLPAGLCTPTAGIPRHSVVEVSTACTAKKVANPLCAPGTRATARQPTGSGASSPSGANGSSSFAGTLLPDGGVAPSGTGTGTGTDGGAGSGSDGGTGSDGGGAGSDGGNGGGDSGADSGDDDHEAGHDGGGASDGGTEAGGTSADGSCVNPRILILGPDGVYRPSNGGC